MARKAVRAPKRGKRKLDLDRIWAQQRRFTRARDWEQFHTPKNLSMALAAEAAELLEIFQWLTPEQSMAVMKNRKAAEAVRHELSDILYYLLRLCDLLDVDLEKAFWGKLRLNAKKYPVAKARGNARKYTDLSTLEARLARRD